MRVTKKSRWLRSLSFFVSLKSLPEKKRVRREQEVNQFLTALCSVLSSVWRDKNGTNIRFIKSKSRLSGCPVQITSASFYGKGNTLSFFLQEDFIILPKSFAHIFPSSGPEYRETAWIRVLRYTCRKKLKFSQKIFCRLLMSNGAVLSIGALYTPVSLLCRYFCHR